MKCILCTGIFEVFDCNVFIVSVISLNLCFNLIFYAGKNCAKEIYLPDVLNGAVLNKLLILCEKVLFARILSAVFMYSNHLNTRLVWYSNGIFVFGC